MGKRDGYRDKERKKPVTVNTIFQAASISKPITAVAALEAFDSKNLSLDENVNDVLKSWKIPQNHFTDKKAVTMRLLLAHSAGIAGFRFKGYKTSDTLPTLKQVLNGVKPANTPSIVVVRVPDEKYEYSPAGYTIVQQVLEDIYKKPFANVMQNLILDPLKMSRSTFAERIPDNLQKNIALPYLPDGKLMPDAPLTFVASAAGGLWSTPSDLANFVIAVQKTLNGKSEFGFSANEMKQMLKPVVSHNMGLGFEVNVNKYGEEVSGEGNYFRHGGFNSGYLSMFVGSKESGNGVVVMINAAPYMDAKTIPQYDFLAKAIKYISVQEGWS